MRQDFQVIMIIHELRTPERTQSEREQPFEYCASVRCHAFVWEQRIL